MRYRAQRDTDINSTPVCADSLPNIGGGGRRGGAGDLAWDCLTPAALAAATTLAVRDLDAKKEYIDICLVIEAVLDAKKQYINIFLVMEPLSCDGPT